VAENFRKPAIIKIERSEAIKIERSEARLIAVGLFDLRTAIKGWNYRQSP